MRLGVISDTHGHVENTRQAVRMLESLEVDHLLHCGDIGTPEIVQMLAAWPADFVLGNCDYDAAALQTAIEAAGQGFHGTFGELNLAGRKIALLHSHERAKFRQVTENESWDLVCYGHSHVAAIDQKGPTLIVNPGAVYRANPLSIAIVDLKQMQATIVNL